MLIHFLKRFRRDIQPAWHPRDKEFNLAGDQPPEIQLDPLVRLQHDQPDAQRLFGLHLIYQPFHFSALQLDQRPSGAC